VAHSLSAKKRARQNVTRRARNRARKSTLKTQIRHYSELIHETTDMAVAEKELRTTQKKIDKLAAKGTIHKNTAARRKSKLARRLNALKTKAR
jgi:small subunit ribosomal protein S20